MNVVEIFINDPVNAKLDMDQNFNIALQYSIADIRDISKRNAAYSKTVMLPGTKTNNYWFGNLFDINSDFTSFNPNKKTDCKVLVNGEIVIDGFLQLRKINKDINVDHEGNNIMYECVVYNNFVDLMTELGERTLYELDLSEFNHVFDLASITDSWTHTWQDGYVYPMYGIGDSDYNYNIDHFWPSPFYKMVFDRILSEAGFGWTGSFKNNAQFEKEIIAYIKDGNVYIDETEKERRKFRAEVIGNTEVFVGNWINNYGGGQIGTGNVVPFNDDFTTPNFDNDDHWSITAYEWTIDRNGTYDLNVKLDFDYILYNNSGYLAFNTNSNNPTNYGQAVRFSPRVQKWNGSSWTTLINLPVVGQSGNSWNTPGTNYVLPTSISNGASYSVNVTFAEQVATGLQLLENEKVRVVIRVDKVGPNNGSGYSNPVQTAGFYLGDTGPGYTAITIPTYISFNADNNYIFNDAYTTEIVQGDTLDLGVFLPDKIKQKDIITDLIKRYNLFIEVDPDNQRLLVINERPYFYAPQRPSDVLDWTYKKDFSQQDNIELLSELQFKEMLFTWTEDTDTYNQNYRDITGDIYGQYEYIFDNDFVKGVKEIKSPFSPTPLVKTDFDAFVSAIDPENPKVKPRILYWGGLKTYSSVWNLFYLNQTGSGATVSQTFTSYPYAGHWDDPIEPTLDINFWAPKFMFYNDWTQLPTKNMYNTYWSNYVHEIEEGRLVTSYFWLDETDIRFIKDNFNSKIFIKDSYYYVNKIFDYQPLEYKTTKVELIKINDGITFLDEGNSVYDNVGTFSCPDDMIAKRKGNVYFYVSASGATVSQACCESVGGKWDATTGTCRVKKVITRPIINEWSYFTKQLKGSGNYGSGVFIGNRNTSPITKFRFYNNDWVLSDGFWNDESVWVDNDYWFDDGEDNYFTRTTRQFIFGDSNTTTADTTIIAGGDFNQITSPSSMVMLGDYNILDGNTNIILGGSRNNINGYNNTLLSSYGNTVSNDGNILIGANSITTTASNTIFLGNFVTVDINTGAISQNGSTFSLSGTAGYIPKFIGTNTLANSGWVDVGDITAYITSAGTYSVIHYYNQSLFPKGSLSSPGIAFIDDNENGLYYSASNVYMVATTKFNVMINGATTSTFDNKALDMWNKPIQRHRWSVTTITGTSSLTTETTNYVIADGGGTMYLPTAADGRPLTIKNSGASLVYVQATASQTIDGSTASLPLSQWESVDLIGDGNNWFIV